MRKTAVFASLVILSIFTRGIFAKDAGGSEVRPDLHRLEVEEAEKYQLSSRLYNEYETAEKELREWNNQHRGRSKKSLTEQEQYEFDTKRNDAGEAMDSSGKHLEMIRATIGSSPENIEAFWRYYEAKKIYDKVRAAYKVNQKGPPKWIEKNESIEQYRLRKAKWQKNHQAVYDEHKRAGGVLHAARAEVEIRPTFAASKDGVLTKKEYQKQISETRHVHEMIGSLCKRLGKAAYIQKLKTMEDQYKNHPAQVSIILSLAMAHSDSLDIATTYYRRAAEHPDKSNRGSTQQSARREWADLLAKHGDYKQAVEVLSKAKSSGWCGTGVATSTTKRAFKIWRWRFEYESKETVYADMWQQFQEDTNILSSMGNSYEGLALIIRSMYIAEDLPQLKQAMEKSRSRIESNIEPGKKRKYHIREFKKVLDELNQQLGYIERIKRACDEELANELIALGQKDRWGELKELFEDKKVSSRLWRARIVLKAAKGKESVARILLADAKQIQYNRIALCAIGQTGTPEAVEFLKELASKEGNINALKYYYFSLLLTGQAEAEKFVIAAAQSQQKGNKPFAGKWALGQFPNIKVPEPPAIEAKQPATEVKEFPVIISADPNAEILEAVEKLMAKGPAADANTHAKIDKLINDLGRWEDKIEIDGKKKEVRYYAQGQLKKIGDIALPQLIEAAGTHRYWRVRKHSLKVIFSICRRGGDEKKMEHLPVLVRSLFWDKDADVRTTAIKLIYDIGKKLLRHKKVQELDLVVSCLVKTMKSESYDRNRIVAGKQLIYLGKINLVPEAMVKKYNMKRLIKD